MLIKIFENIFSGRDSMLQCLNYQKKNESLLQKCFRKKCYIAVQAALRQRFNQTPPCKKTIQQNFTKYRSHGMSLKRNKEIWKMKD